jgi:hypothetical protein
MICCVLIDNFTLIFLHIPLFTLESLLLTISVDCFSLIMNESANLSTTPNFGANIISLLFFSAKKSGNLSKWD